MLHTPAELSTGPEDGRRARAALIAVDAEGSGPRLAALLAMLRRGRVTLIACATLIPLAASIAVLQMTPRYTATGALLYEPSAYAVQELQSILRVDPTTDAVMASQVEILRSQRMAGRLVEELGLADRAEFNAALRPPGLGAGALAAARRLALRALAQIAPALAARLAAQAGAGASEDRLDAVQVAVQDAIAVQTVHASRVLSVGFTSEDKALAARAANRLMALYLTDQLEAKFDAVRQANGWLETRTAELRREVHDAEDRIAAYRTQAGLVQGVQAGLETEQISRRSADLAGARNDLAAAESRLDQARGRAGAAAQAAVAASVVGLRAHQEELAGQLQSLLARLGPNHPDVIALRSQAAEAGRAVGAEIARVVAAAEADVRSARARVAALEAALAESQAQMGRDARSQVPLNAMEREADAARSLLQTVLERAQQTAQQTVIEKPDARVISAALPPASPSAPRSLLLIGAAAAFGLCFGLLMTYLLELADTTFRSGADVRALLGQSCHALVPEIGRRALGRLRVADYVVLKPLSPFAEQMRALRAGLWLGPDRPQVVAITAARPGEGKTTVAIGLGRSAVLSGERVIAIDCDVRQPAFGRLLRADGDAGMIDVLLGRAALAEVIRRDALTGMDYLPAGSAEANSLGLFMSEAMHAILDALRKDYDLVLLDAPPLLAMTDARVVARLADATLLCVRWRDTPHSIVRSAIELLGEAHALLAGIALTRVDARVHVRSGFADAEIYHPRYGGYFRD